MSRVVFYFGEREVGAFDFSPPQNATGIARYVCAVGLDTAQGHVGVEQGDDFARAVVNEFRGDYFKAVIINE